VGHRFLPIRDETSGVTRLTSSGSEWYPFDEGSVDPAAPATGGGAHSVAVVRDGEALRNEPPLDKIPWTIRSRLFASPPQRESIWRASAQCRYSGGFLTLGEEPDVSIWYEATSLRHDILYRGTSHACSRMKRWKIAGPRRPLPRRA